MVGFGKEPLALVKANKLAMVYAACKLARRAPRPPMSGRRKREILDHYANFLCPQDDIGVVELR